MLSVSGDESAFDLLGLQICGSACVAVSFFFLFVVFFLFQAEDGIRDLVRSRGLGDVYKRQGLSTAPTTTSRPPTMHRYRPMPTLMLLPNRPMRSRTSL